VDGEGDEEEEEETVVTATDAIGYPGAVVIEGLWGGWKRELLSIKLHTKNSPRCSDYTRNNGSILAVDRIYMSRTTSFER
jgi:hypothetical protein